MCNIAVAAADDRYGRGLNVIEDCRIVEMSEADNIRILGHNAQGIAERLVFCCGRIGKRIGFTDHGSA